MDAHSRNTALALRNPERLTADSTAALMDARDLDGIVKVVQGVGVVSGTTPSMTGTIEDSADGLSDWQTILTFDAVTASGNKQEKSLNISSARRWIRHKADLSGTSPQFDVCCYLVGGKNRV